MFVKRQRFPAALERNHMYVLYMYNMRLCNLSQDEKLAHILEGTHEKEMGSWYDDGRKYFVDLSDSWNTFSNIS